MNVFKIFLSVLAFMAFSLSPAQAQRTAAAVATVVNGFVVDISVTDGGADYANPPWVKITGGGGRGATAVATLTNGAVSQIIVENAGRGYSSTPAITIAPLSVLPGPGLVAYYPLNGDAFDQSGHANHGSVFGATLTQDRSGLPDRAYRFNGKSWIQLPDSILPFDASELTLSAWVLADGGSFGSQQSLVHLTTRRGECGLAITADTPISFGFGVHLQNSGWQANPGPVIPNAWTHLVGTYKKGQYTQFWINGSLVCSNAIPNDPLFTLPGYALNSSMGMYDYAPSPYQGFTGAIDDVCIFNRALSSSEIQNLYSFVEPKPVDIQINVKTIEVRMTVKPLKKYQLESSLDLMTWSKVGDSFTATTTEVVQEYNAIEVGRYFRLSEMPE